MNKSLEVPPIFNTILTQVAAIIDNPVVLFSLLFVLGAANLFFPPIPLETATLFAGYLSANGHGSVIIIIIATTGGMFSGSFLLYQITKTYGMSLIEKTPLQQVISRNLSQKAFQWFKKYGLYTMYLGKLVPGMSLYTVICCGILKLETKKAVPVILLSNLLFFMALALAGRLLGANWGYALPWLTKIGGISLALMGIFTIGILLKCLINYRTKAKK
jgi:membrane protein DedA with SNARE-associated domain